MKGFFIFLLGAVCATAGPLPVFHTNGVITSPRDFRERNLLPWLRPGGGVVFVTNGDQGLVIEGGGNATNAIGKVDGSGTNATLVGTAAGTNWLTVGAAGLLYTNRVNSNGFRVTSLGAVSADNSISAGGGFRGDGSLVTGLRYSNIVDAPQGGGGASNAIGTSYGRGTNTQLWATRLVGSTLFESGTALNVSGASLWPWDNDNGVTVPLDVAGPVQASNAFRLNDGYGNWFSISNNYPDVIFDGPATDGYFRFHSKGRGFRFDGPIVATSLWLGSANVTNLALWGPVTTNYGDLVQNSATPSKLAAFDANRKLVASSFSEADFASSAAISTATNDLRDALTNSQPVVRAGRLVGDGSGLTNLNYARITNAPPLSQVSVKWFGASGDGTALSNVWMTAGSASLLSTNAAFTSADVGKLILVDGAGPGGATNDLLTTIAAVVNPSNVTLNASAATTVQARNAVYGTDDATAIQACLNYGVTNRLRVYFPAGIYVVNGGFQSPSTKNAIFTIPNMGQAMSGATAWDNASPVILEGEGLGATGAGIYNYGWFGSWIACVNATNSGGAVFQFGDDHTGSLGYNNVVVRFKGLSMRLPNNPTISAVDCLYTSGNSMEDVNIFAGHNSYATVVVPTTSTSVGLRMSNNGYNGNGLNTLDRVQIAGFYYGLRAAEHTHLRSITLYSCRVGVHWNDGSYHLSSSDRLGLQSCITGLAFSSSYARVELRGVEIEHGTGAWTTTCDVSDAGNQAEGVMTYTVYNSGLLVNGAAGLKRMGLKGPMTGTFLAPTAGTADGYVLTLNNGTNTWAASTGGTNTGSQTPWTSDINGAGHSLTNVGSVSGSGLTVSGGTSNWFGGQNVMTNLTINVGTSNWLGGVTVGTNLSFAAIASAPTVTGQNITLWNSNGAALYATSTNGTKLILSIP